MGYCRGFISFLFSLFYCLFCRKLSGINVQFSFCLKVLVDEIELFFFFPIGSHSFFFTHTKPASTNEMLLWRNLVYNITLPFKNLNKEDRIIQLCRLFTCLIAIVCCLACIVAPRVTNTTYAARINCSHLDVANGLYESLRNSVTQVFTPAIFNDQMSGTGNSLTTSEIKLITEYAETQVAGSPQYCISSLWTWCYGNYETYTVVGKDGEIHIKKKNEVLTCTDKSSYVFDYINQLESIGLEIILAYAYQSSTFTTTLYEKQVSSRNAKFQLAFNGIIFTCCAQFVILICIFVIYSNRGSSRDLSKIPSLVLHVVTLISLASSLSIIIGLAMITNLFIITRNEIKSKLGDFGVTFHMGSKWFLFLSLSAVFATLSLMSWVFPMWCANPLISLTDQDDVVSFYEVPTRRTEFERHTDFRAKRSTAKFKSFEPNSGHGRNKIGNIFHNPRHSAHQDDHHEEEMRKLGESLSKKSSVRRTKSLGARKAELEEQGILLDNFTFKDEYPTIQEETYDGYSSRSVSRSALDKVSRKVSDKRQRHLIREVIKSPFDEEDKTDGISPRNSYLEDDELQLLDNQMFNLKK